METQKLYYEDSHLREFTAVVVSCTQTEKGYEILLDQTAFYPEGGGQACDLGSLSDANVLDVRERGEQVCHLCDKALAVGQTVTGRIDWQRRFDLMQQHTGEHILSGLIHSRFGYQNSGFHVGAQVMEVDFDGPIPPEALAEPISSQRLRTATANRFVIFFIFLPSNPLRPLIFLAPQNVTDAKDVKSGKEWGVKLCLPPDRRTDTIIKKEAFL